MLLQYFVFQCPQLMCPFYQVGQMCTTRCNNCGTLCEAFPITDLSSLQLYKSKGCTIIVGDLYITGLESTIIKKVLYDNLQRVEYIRGDLYFKDNLYISAMTSFSNLKGVYGIHYINNPILVDTRMPALVSMTGNVTVIGCDRLCPARYTFVGKRADDASCSESLLNMYCHIDGDIQVSELELVASVLRRTVSSLTNLQVCTNGISSVKLVYVGFFFHIIDMRAL